MNNTVTISKDRLDQLQKCEDELRVLKLLCKSIAEIANKDYKPVRVGKLRNYSKRYDAQTRRTVRNE